MRKVFLFIGLVLALGALAVFLPGSARSAAHGTNLPFNGPSAGHMTLNLATGELHTWGYPVPIMHLGLRTSEGVGWAYPDGFSGFNVFATVTGTAANGDHLFATVTNDSTVFTGGTGRFEGVTGYSIMTSQQFTNIVISADGILSADMAGYGEGELNLNRP